MSIRYFDGPLPHLYLLVDSVCVASNYHQETWNPNWNLRTLVLSLRGFMTTKANEIGSISSDAATHRKLASESQSYICPFCGIHHSRLLPHISRSILPTILEKTLFYSRDESIGGNRPQRIPTKALHKRDRRRMELPLSRRRFVPITMVFRLIIFSLSFFFLFLINRSNYSFDFSHTHLF